MGVYIIVLAFGGGEAFSPHTSRFALRGLGALGVRERAGVRA